VLARGSCFHSTFRPGQSRLTELPSGQKAKMLAGELYLATDPELVAADLRAQELLFLFNATRPGADSQRRALLVELFDTFASGAVLRPSFRCDYGSNISIGEDTFINYDCVFLDCNRITLGREVQIAPRVQIYTATHPLDAARRRSKLEFALPVVIGDGAWLGGGVIVCPGVTIGQNTVVGAGSVVTRDLPDGVLAVGNPCRVLRTL
jgi:maltose O-acetyltransferase